MRLQMLRNGGVGRARAMGAMRAAVTAAMTGARLDGSRARVVTSRRFAVIARQAPSVGTVA